MELKDIESYFVYKKCRPDVDSYIPIKIEILPRYEEGTKEYEQAIHMIEILDLNHDKLKEKRAASVTKIKRGKPFKKDENIFPNFYSMLVQFGLL